MSVVAMREWQRLIVQIANLRAEIEKRAAHAHRLCARSAKLVAEAHQHILESRDLLVRLSEDDRRLPPPSHY